MVLLDSSERVAVFRESNMSNLLYEWKAPVPHVFETLCDCTSSELTVRIGLLNDRFVVCGSKTQVLCSGVTEISQFRMPSAFLLKCSQRSRLSFTAEVVS